MDDPTLVPVDDLEESVERMHSDDIAHWAERDEREMGTRGAAASVGPGMYTVRGIARQNVDDGGIPRSTGEFAHPEDSRFMSGKFQASLIEREKLLRLNPCFMFWNNVMAALSDKSAGGSPFDEDQVNNTLRREAAQRGAEESIKDARIRINDLSDEKDKIIGIVSQTAEDVARVEGRIGRDPVLRQLDRTKKSLVDMQISNRYLKSRLTWYVLIHGFGMVDNADAKETDADVAIGNGLAKNFITYIESGYVSDDSTSIINGSRSLGIGLSDFESRVSDHDPTISATEYVKTIKSIVADEAGIPRKDWGTYINGTQDTVDRLFRKVLVTGLYIHMKNMFALMRAEIDLSREETALPSVVSTTMKGVGTFANLDRLRKDALETERQEQFDEEAFLTRMDHEARLRERMAGAEARPRTGPMSTTVTKEVEEIPSGGTEMVAVSRETTTTVTTPIAKEAKPEEEDEDEDDDDEVDAFGFARDTHTEPLFSGAAFVDVVDKLDVLVSKFEKRAPINLKLISFTDADNLLSVLNSIGGYGILDRASFPVLSVAIPTAARGMGGAAAAAAAASTVKAEDILIGGFTRRELHETFSLFAKIGGYQSMELLSTIGSGMEGDPIKDVMFPFSKAAASAVSKDDHWNITMSRTDMLHPIMMTLFDTVHGAVVDQAKEGKLKLRKTDGDGNSIMMRPTLSKSERVIYDNIMHAGDPTFYQDSIVYASVIYRIYLLITANNLRANQSENEGWYDIITKRWSNAIIGLPSTRATDPAYTVENRYAMTPQMSGVFMVRLPLIAALGNAWMYIMENPHVARSGVSKETIMSKNDMLSHALARFTGLMARSTEIGSRRDYQPRGAIEQQKRETAHAVDMFLRLFRAKYRGGMAQLGAGGQRRGYSVFR